MATETISPEMKKGQKVIKTLREMQSTPNLRPTVTFDPHGLDNCLYFTKFPNELSEIFPGSYIPPKHFFEELGIQDEKISQSVEAVLSKRTAVDEMSPIYEHKDEQGDFALTLWNGAFNKYSQKISKIVATSNLKADPYARAEYQDTLFNITKLNITNKGVNPRGEALRIHDDCLASGDSIIGFLSAILENKEDQVRVDNLKKNGVEIIIDGPATAQGILFLRAFAKSNGIKLKIDAGYMAFGLSEGVIGKKGKREHANYITYPDELLKLIDHDTAQEIRALKSEDENIQVVGDMGVAQEGIHQDMMDAFRTNFKGDNKYCFWNDTREDPHGDHPNRKTAISPQRDENKTVENVYFPFGGYLPREFDRKLNKNHNEANEVIIDAARMWIEGEEGFGAAYYKEGMKPR
jgi:hypothetical protein